MSRRTMTKLGRMFIGFKDQETGQIVQIRKETTDAPEPRQPIDVELGSLKIREYVAPGQIISAKRALRRYQEGKSKAV